MFLAAGAFFCRRAGSGGFEDQDSVVVQLDLFGLPGGSLIEFIGIGIGGIPRAVEPPPTAETQDLKTQDRRRRGLSRRALASTLVETPLQAIHSHCRCSSSLTKLRILVLCLQVFCLYRTLEWIATPDLENQVAPEGAHVADGLLG